ncbi:MFS transporter [Bacillus sp. FJAT-45037]|uniref:MFS transporter n=1 Tax=Bacillus sp. FJAT-45037 TaxID=2011007 RepID=UPI000C237A6E|nr:MFS transporter [Bacillus sp. FJAT-45037]
MKLFFNRDFSCLFFGRVVTNIGDTMYAVAAMWLVAELGGSTFYTGLAGFLTIFPRLVQFLSGPVIDRVPIRLLLVSTQVVQSILLLIIPVAHYTGFLSVALVLIISPIITTFNMFVYPAQMAALPTFVEKKELTKANSLFTFAYQGIETGCNAIAGVLIVAVGAISVYLIDSVMFLIGAILFLMIQTPKKQKVQIKQERELLSTHFKRYISDLSEGTKILFGKKIARLLLGVMTINFVGGATFVVLPAYSQYQGGAEVYGMLLMAQALGSLIGALLAPYLKLERFGMGKVYAIAFLLSGLLWGIAVFAPSMWLTVILYGVAWVPGGVTNILINTCLQKGIPERLLGRVFSAAFSLSGIAMPVGSLLGGLIGLYIHSMYIISASGLIVALVGMFWLVDRTTQSLPKIEDFNEETFIPKELQLKAN